MYVLEYICCLVCILCSWQPATVEPITAGQAARDYLAQAVNPTLLKGLTELCKKKPQDPVVSMMHELHWHRVTLFRLGSTKVSSS